MSDKCNNIKLQIVLSLRYIYENRVLHFRELLIQNFELSSPTYILLLLHFDLSQPNTVKSFFLCKFSFAILSFIIIIQLQLEKYNVNFSIDTHTHTHYSIKHINPTHVLIIIYTEISLSRSHTNTSCNSLLSLCEKHISRTDMPPTLLCTRTHDIAHYKCSLNIIIFDMGMYE